MAKHIIRLLLYIQSRRRKHEPTPGWIPPYGVHGAYEGE